MIMVIKLASPSFVVVLEKQPIRTLDPINSVFWLDDFGVQVQNSNPINGLLYLLLYCLSSINDLLYLFVYCLSSINGLLCLLVYCLSSINGLLYLLVYCLSSINGLLYLLVYCLSSYLWVFVHVQQAWHSKQSKIEYLLFLCTHRD